MGFRKQPNPPPVGYEKPPPPPAPPGKDMPSRRSLLAECFIPGNQEDPLGNPIPYYRTTQRGKWKDPGAARYAAWKAYVCQNAAYVGEIKLNFCALKKEGCYRLDVICHFKDDPIMGCRHADPENVRKGIQDALFEKAGDSHVWGEVTFTHLAMQPGALVRVFEEAS